MIGYDSYTWVVIYMELMLDANTQTTTDHRSNTKMSLNLVSPSFPCSPVPLFSRVSGHTPSLSYLKIENLPLNPKAQSKRNAAPPRKCALRASNLETDVARRSANYSPTVWDFNFIQSLTSAYKVIIPIHNSHTKFCVEWLNGSVSDGRVSLDLSCLHSELEIARLRSSQALTTATMAYTSMPPYDAQK